MPKRHEGHSTGVHNFRFRAEVHLRYPELSRFAMLRSAVRTNIPLKLAGKNALSLSRRQIYLKADRYPTDMSFHQDFFSAEEQRLLLVASLQKLDNTENRKVRRRQREFLASRPAATATEDLFLPNEYYTFEEVSITTSVMSLGRC